MPSLMPGSSGGDPGLRRRGTLAYSSPARGGSAVVRPLAVRIGHALGITAPRRAAMLAAAVCVLALSVTVPLRNYLDQRAELAMVHEQQQDLADKVAELQRRRALLADPQHVQAQARERLRYVRPGEAPYLVQLPAGGTAASTGSVGSGPSGGAGEPLVPWYTHLWESINRG